MRPDIHRTGVINEIKAQQWYFSRGYDVFAPLDNKTRADFVAVNPKTGEVTKVQVKTVQENNVDGKIYLQARLLSSNGETVYSEACCDVIFFVYHDRYWIAPIKEVAGLTSVCLDRLEINNLPYKSRTAYDPKTWMV